MSRNWIRIMTTGIGLSWLLVMTASTLVSVEASHDKLHRTDQCRRGDAKHTQRIASHVTDYAVERFKLEHLVTEADIDRTEKEMYNFLKWKLGGPTAVCAQYITADYKHFRNAYSDEAAAMALGIIHFSKQEPELVMPKWMQNYLKDQAGAAAAGISGYLTAQGVPAPLAAALGNQVFQVLSKGIDRNVAAFIPKAYDVDNRLVQAAIKARQQAGHVNPGPKVLRKRAPASED